MGDEAADTSAPIRVLRPCEVAQAAMFAEILRTEVGDLRARLQDAEQRWEHRCRRCRHELDPPAGLIRLREQLDEAVGLLASLERVPGVKSCRRATTRAAS
jgi:hypothetical protein